MQVKHLDVESAATRMDLHPLRRKTPNTLVRQSAVSRSELRVVTQLKVISKCSLPGGSRSKSFAWKHIGELHYCPDEENSESEKAVLVDKDFLFCQPCLLREQNRYKANKNGHLSEVKRYSRSTSSSTMVEHLLQVHDIKEEKEETPSTSLAKFLKPDKACLQPAKNSQELAQDLAIWFSLDLEPFSKVEKKGFRHFMEKNMPKLEMPSESSVRRSALSETYDMVKRQVINDMEDVPAVCLLFDGWTDKYRMQSYMGIKAAYINQDWEFRIITISCKSLDLHTASSIADHIRKELQPFINIRKTKLYSTHDGAANMRKASSLLRVNKMTHCSAHAINLLLMADGVLKTVQLCVLIESCKEIVKCLNFKGHMIEEELKTMHDRDFIENMMEKIASAEEEISLDERFSLDQVVIANIETQFPIQISVYHSIMKSI